jgi:hypothetical protein
MTKSYPIWNEVEACIYNSSKSYGVKEKGIVNVKVGTSRTYSFDFVNHKTTKKEITKDLLEYHFYVDDVLIKRSQFNKKTKEFKFLSIN